MPTAAPTPAPPSDEVTNLRLSSDASGELTITWDAPSSAPADYRVAWARADLSWLSWDASDETHRGSSYPGGADTSLTLTGLTGGETYRARMRSRYNPGTSDGRSGPWTDEATQRVSGDAPAAPAALSAEEATVKGQTSIALSWTAPSHDALTGYRIWRGADADSLAKLVEDTGDTATGYSDAATEADNTYVYAVTALSLDGDSPRSATTSITRGGGGTTTRDDPPPEDDENTVVEPEELIAQQQQGSDEVILIANYTGGTNFGGEIDFTKGATQFTTGNNKYGYLLTKVTHVIFLNAAGTGTVGAALHADDAGIPGAELYAFPDQTFTHTTAQLVTHVGEVLLERNTKYWVVLTRRESSTVDVYISRKSPSAALTAQPGWSLTTPSSHYTSGTWTDEPEINAIRLDGVVRTTVTDEPDDRDFPMDASTLGSLKIGTTSTGTLDSDDDKRSGDLLRIEGLTAGNSYRVRAWFGTSKEDSATAARGGAIGLQFSRAGIALASLSPHNDNLLDDGRASFVFPAFANEDYYVDLVAPAFRPPDGSNPAYTYYGPYMLEIYDLGPTQRQGQPGYSVKASNICVNNRCYNDPRFPEFHQDGYENTETHEVSVGNNPLSKNLSQAVNFRAGTAGPTAKFQVDRVEVFVHSMTGGSIPKAAIHVAVGGGLGDKLFDLEPLYNDDGHIDAFIAPRDAQALNRNSRYLIAFTEGGGSNASYKLYATAMGGEDSQADSMWPIDDSGITYDSDLANPVWESMRSGDTTSGTLVLPQFRIYAGVAE